MSKTKAIAYAYATSTTATKYGCGQTGCYFLEIYRADSWDVDREIGPFDTWREAFEEARQMPEPWHRYSAAPQDADDAQAFVDGLRKIVDGPPGRVLTDAEWRLLHAAESVLWAAGKLQTATYNED